MKAARAFTLVELLVAISLATIITLLGVSLMRTSINNSVRNEEALAQHQTIRDAQRLIEHAWSGRQTNGFSAKDNQIEFVSSQKAVGSLPLRFTCQHGEGSDLALWFYKVAAARDGQADDPLPGISLLSGLTSCKFGYLQAPADDKQSAVWIDAWPTDKPPPSLIRLDLATSHGALPPLIFAASGA